VRRASPRATSFRIKTPPGSPGGVLRAQRSEGWRGGGRGMGALCRYIDGQEEHHRTRTFQEEFRAFLVKYGVDFDEAFVWD